MEICRDLEIPANYLNGYYDADGHLLDEGIQLDIPHPQEDFSIQATVLLWDLEGGRPESTSRKMATDGVNVS